MQLKYNRQPSLGSSIFKTLIKLILLIVVFIIAIFLIEKISFPSPGKKYQIDSTMVSKGIDQTYTAMAKTVGLPVAIATLKILNGEIKSKGVQIPIKSTIYKSILKELENFDIIFKEKSTNYLGYNILNS